jgi:hypothetical protein
MERKLGHNSRDETRDGWDLDDLLHPAQAFEHPAGVVNDPDLTINEKRAILASWASDACAVEASPDLRTGPRGSAVRFDDIMDALRTLDKLSTGETYRRSLRRQRLFRRSPRDGESNTGTSLQ